MQQSIFVRYGYLWVTLLLFLLSFIGHWSFAWMAFVDEQASHGETAEVNEYFVEVVRDTLENWQSEFLQLIWQVAGLAFLLYIGSPQSKEGDERKEEKLDLILKAAYGTDADRIFAQLDTKYPRK